MVKILYVASEAVPFIHTGRLADFVGTLPKFLNKDEYDARIIVPKYSCIESQFKKTFHFISHFYVSLGWRKQYVGIIEAQYDETTFYFIDNEYYFFGDSPYGEVLKDLEKFAFFSKAVIEALPIIGFQPDIIHCNDWQTSLIPVYLKTYYMQSSFYKYMKTVLTIHSIVYQGRWNKQPLLDMIGLNDLFLTSKEMDIGDDISFLKGGILYADYITTISEMHARNIQQPILGEGLEEEIKSRLKHFIGIPNGIDFSRYNPQTDSHIIKRYSVQDVQTGKNANKLSIQSNSTLAENNLCFLIGIIFRTMNERNLDILTNFLEKIIENPYIQLVIMGKVPDKKELCTLSNRFSEKIFFQNTYSEEFAHKIYASSDIFLSLDYYEPGELSHLINMRYGTIPLMYRYNGVYPMEIEDFSEKDQGSVFFYESYNEKTLIASIKSIYTKYEQNKIEWFQLIQNAMSCNNSWDYTKNEYEKIYTKLLT